MTQTRITWIEILQYLYNNDNGGYIDLLDYFIDKLPDDDKTVPVNDHDQIVEVLDYLYENEFIKFKFLPTVSIYRMLSTTQLLCDVETGEILDDKRLKPTEQKYISLEHLKRLRDSKKNAVNPTLYGLLVKIQPNGVGEIFKMEQLRSVTSTNRSVRKTNRIQIVFAALTISIIGYGLFLQAMNYKREDIQGNK